MRSLVAGMARFVSRPIGQTNAGSCAFGSSQGPLYLSQASKFARRWTLDSSRTRPRWSILGLGSALTGLALIGLAMWPVPAMAGEGNPNYLGILASSAPTGYTPSPSSYGVGSQLAFQFTVKNLTLESQSMTLQLHLNHIVTYTVNGQQLNVSDGQPGIANGAVVDGSFAEQLSTQAADSSPTSIAFTIGPGASKVVSMSRSLPSCGYFQVDVGKAGASSQKGLVGLEIRVLGCQAAAPSPSPSPTGSPSPKPSPSAGATPTPSGGGATGGTTGTGGVSGTTATSGVPLAETGANPPALLFGGLLVGLGLVMSAVGALARMRRRRRT